MSDMTLAGLQALLADARRLGLTPVYRYATVSSFTGTNPSILLAVLDGDTMPSRCFNLVGARWIGSRVLTVEIKPHGVYAIGAPDIDNGWVEVLSRDFGTGWSSVGGSTFRNVAYRLTVLGNVEISGRAVQSGTVSAPSTIFTLPEGYRPIGRTVTIGWAVNNNPAAATAPTVRGLEVTSAGLVRVTNFAGTIQPGPICFDGLFFAIRTV